MSIKCISSELVLTGDGMYIEHGVSGLVLPLVVSLVFHTLFWFHHLSVSKRKNMRFVEMQFDNFLIAY